MAKTEKYEQVKKYGKVAGAVLAGAIVGAVGFAAIYEPTPVVNPIDASLKTQNAQLVLNEAALVADLKTATDKVKTLEALPPTVVIETKVVNQTKIVEVDSKNLATVLQSIYDNNGNVEFLIDDLNDDEVAEIADRVVFVNEIKTLAVNEVKSEFAREMNKETFGSVTFDKDDIERIKVQDDMDQIVVSDIEFDDKDADLVVTVRFEQDDVKYTADVVVEIKDSEIDSIAIDNIELR